MKALPLPALFPAFTLLNHKQPLYSYKTAIFWDMMPCPLAEVISVPQKRWYHSTRLHDLTSQKTAVLTLAIVITLSSYYYLAVGLGFPNHCCCR
jgi:hypothetical protein